MRLGASFSARRASARGLDDRAAFRRLLELGLSPLRLSTYWDEVDQAGYGELDWQLAEAGRAGREVLLSVGMKAQGWPEFAIPERFVPTTRRGGGVGGSDLRQEVIGLVERTVERYRDMPAVIAWQVENEPLNRSGPRRWWIAPELVRDQLAAARRADPGRPVVLNVFAAFNAWLDVVSSRHGLRRLLGTARYRCEVEALGLLEPGDILGLDVYRRIGYQRLWGRRFTSSRRWRDDAARWREQAAAEGKRAWIIEAQAEPWEPGLRVGQAPGSCQPEDVIETVEAFREVGHEAVLLWGVEHWLAQDASGDGSWLRAVERLIEGR